MKKAKLAQLLTETAEHAATSALDALEARRSQYDEFLSVLTLRFAEGSDPAAVSIPYRPWQNEESVNLSTIRVVKDGETGPALTAEHIKRIVEKAADEERDRIRGLFRALAKDGSNKGMVRIPLDALEDFLRPKGEQQ